MLFFLFVLFVCNFLLFIGVNETYIGEYTSATAVSHTFVNTYLLILQQHMLLSIFSWLLTVKFSLFWQCSTMFCSGMRYNLYSAKQINYLYRQGDNYISTRCTTVTMVTYTVTFYTYFEETHLVWHLWDKVCLVVSVLSDVIALLMALMAFDLWLKSSVQTYKIQGFEPCMFFLIHILCFYLKYFV